MKSYTLLGLLLAASAQAAPSSSTDYAITTDTLDFGGQRNPDGQGFAAFGQVVKGFDVVHKIHISACQKQTLTPPIRIQRAIRLN